ncbi:MAG: ImuA family protein [Cyclobacteriaceae bacterium]|nr:Error-prone repair protein ImuA [Flammeovirgaceae bacterium]
MAKAEMLAQLQSDILRLQGFKPAGSGLGALSLGAIDAAFPNRTFPTGAVHEVVSPASEDLAAASGFLTGLMAGLMRSKGVAVWISTRRTVFPPALKAFGIKPDRLLFVEVPRERDALWAMEEALKSPALTAVVGELRDISFTASRRLQLAVEQSQVTGFIINRAAKLTTTACVSRWRITSLPSETPDALPGIGLPQWRVELLRIRNGRPGVWQVQWQKNRFVVAAHNEQPTTNHEPLSQAG